MSPETPSARDLALHILATAAARGRQVEDLLAATLRQHPTLPRPERALLLELVQGVKRWQLRLDHVLAQLSHLPWPKVHPLVRQILRLAAYQILFLDKIPAHAAVTEAVNLARRRRLPLSHVGFINAILRRLAEGDLPPLPALADQPVTALAVATAHPEWLVARWLRRVGPEATQVLLTANNQVPPLTVRVNTLKTDPASLTARLAQEGVTAAACRFSPVGAPEAAGKTKADTRLPIHKQDQWQFFFSPYMWIAGANVSTTAFGHTSKVSVPWCDIVPDLFSNVIGVMGRFEAWKGRWGFFLDSYFVYIGGNVGDSAGQKINLGLLPIPRALVLSGDVKYITRAGNLDFGPRFLVGTLPLSAEKPLPVLSLELLGGGRYNYYHQYLRLGVQATLSGPRGGQVATPGRTFTIDATRSYIEPMLGMRLGLWLTEKVVIEFRGSLGGFGLPMNDNNLDSNLELNFGYRVHKNIYAYLGYRARYDQFNTTDLSFSAWLHGPIIGAVFAF